MQLVLGLTSFMDSKNLAFKTLTSKGLPRGGGFFHSQGTWGCAVLDGILFRTSSLSKGILFCNFGLANGTILNMPAADPFANFSQDPPPVGPAKPVEP